MSGKMTFVGFKDQSAFRVKEAKAYAQGRVDAAKGLTNDGSKFPRDPVAQELYSDGFDSYSGILPPGESPYDAVGKAYPFGG